MTLDYEIRGKILIPRTHRILILFNTI